MHVIITCKYEKYRMKNSLEKVAKLIFLDAQGQLTLWSMFGSGQISNSSKLLCISSLTASMKGSDQEQLRKSGNIVFPIISLWGFFQTL